jgi:hypothetical protein
MHAGRGPAWRLLLWGPGIVILAYLSCTGQAIVSRARIGDESGVAVEARRIENLVAFGRLLGYVRHFHPSDEAVSTDWDSFAIAGVEEVENARTPDELKTRLQRLFGPLAPTLRLSTRPLRPVTLEILRSSGAPARQITGWRHLGWAGPQSAFYRSDRIVALADAPGDSLLPIGSELNSSLGGGVWCSLPLTVYTGDGGTIPRGVAIARTPRRPSDWVPTGDDRATRLAAVILFWNVVQHFSPYSGETSSDWLAQFSVALREAASNANGAEFNTTLRRLGARLRDGHVFQSSPYSRGATRWPFVWEFVEDKLVLVRIGTTLRNRACVGDEVVAIQGKATSQWVEELKALEGGATPQHVCVRIATALTMVGTGTLELELRSPAGARRYIQVSQDPNPSLIPASPDSVQEVQPGVMYLDLNRITEADFVAALPRVNRGRGVVFDLRGYPSRIWMSVISHLTDSTLSSPRLGFPIIVRPDQHDVTYSWSSWSVKPLSPRIRVPAAFLIDGKAISAAETMLGIVEQYRLAHLVGEPTAGTNGVITSVLLPGQYRVSFTGMRVLKHDGSRHHGVGILPTVPVSRTIAGIIAGRDEQLERAVAIVGAGVKDRVRDP